MLKSKSFIILLGIIVPISIFLLVLLSTQMCTADCAGELGKQYASAWDDDGSYSWKTNALSDLGVSKVANLFNYTLIIGGILHSIYGIGILRSFKLFAVPLSTTPSIIEVIWYAILLSIA